MGVDCGTDVQLRHQPLTSPNENIVFQNLMSSSSTAIGRQNSRTSISTADDFGIRIDRAVQRRAAGLGLDVLGSSTAGSVQIRQGQTELLSGDAVQEEVDRVVCVHQHEADGLSK